MLHCLDFLRGMDLLSVTVRVLLAVLCGGMIGIERSEKRRPAGFRTHILICLGAAMTTATSQYVYVVLGLYSDVARLGAQVIAGISFIGAGAIIMTKWRRVRGLTTAAGLAWKSGVAAEVLCLPEPSLGQCIYYTKYYLDIPELFAWTAATVALSMVLERLLRACLARWGRGWGT